MSLVFLLTKLATAIVSVALGAGLLARDHGLKLNRLIAALFFCNGWWATSEFFLFQEADPDTAIIIIRLMAIGWMPLGVLYLHAFVTLSSIEGRATTKMVAPLYLSFAVMLPIGLWTDFVVLRAVATDFGWRPEYNVGMVPAYLILAIPVIATLTGWRRLMSVPESGGKRRLARVIFFGISLALVVGTMTEVILPAVGLPSVGTTTTLVALVGVAAARTLHQFGLSLISPQALAREILDTLEDGVVLVGNGGILRDANRAFLRMIDVSDGSAFDRPIATWIPKFPDCCESTEAATLVEVQRPDGENVPVVLSAPVALNDRGRRSGQAYLLRDRREVVSLQRRLVVSARLAAVGDLSKSISRSIDEPVARTRRELEGLLVDWRSVERTIVCPLPKGDAAEAIDEGHELIEECLEGVDRISSIVKEISEFSSESVQAEYRPHSFAEIVERALRVARIHAPDWLQIETCLDPGVEIDCHAAEIERVVTNLLVNAIHALEKNTRPNAHLVVGVAAQAGRALLHIEDDGCGIEPEILDRIFDPFFTTKPVGKGTGLGLAISYHIVREHGGDIRVSSIHGRGTSATVELPRVDGPRLDAI
jgi:signal transduction histidine kinase